MRRFLPDLIQLIWKRRIDPGKVLDLTLPPEKAPEGYRAMDERRAIKTLSLRDQRSYEEEEQVMSETTDREARAEATYARLFGPRDPSAPDNDPELITVTVLATLNTLDQFKAHTRAALKVGVTPVELREAVYQLAPFIGFPRTLNAVAALNEVLDALGVPLPLPPQTTTDTDRYARGRAIQAPLYGDLYSRAGLELKTRELLVLCALATLGLERQLRPPRHRRHQGRKQPCQTVQVRCSNRRRG